MYFCPGTTNPLNLHRFISHLNTDGNHPRPNCHGSYALQEALQSHSSTSKQPQSCLPLQRFVNQMTLILKYSTPFNITHVLKSKAKFTVFTPTTAKYFETKIQIHTLQQASYMFSTFLSHHQGGI